MNTSPRTPATESSDLWPAARLAVAGMRVCVVVTMIDVLLVGAEYEDRVSWYTHDTDVAVLGFLAALIELVVRMDTVLLVTGCVWVLAASGTAVAFVGWLVPAARNADRLNGRPGPGRRWSIGGQLMSVANVVIPYRVMRAVNEASVAGSRSRPAPGRPVVGGAARHGPARGVRRRLAVDGGGTADRQPADARSSMSVGGDEGR